MTCEEAKMQIQAIPEKIWDQLSEPDREAMEMAFSALQAQEAKAQLSAEGTTFDLISRQAAIALANSLKDDLPDDERMADAVMAHNEGIMEYQTKLSLLPSAQPERKKGKWIDERCSECGCYVYHGDVRNFCPKCGADMRGDDHDL